MIRQQSKGVNKSLTQPSLAQSDLKQDLLIVNLYFQIEQGNIL